ncbi:MAG: BREX-3 system P-loop-containing protein BrxF [Methanomicrobiales archaeon]|jgi:hypothetical protein|nr:BREX-3 system P-loop-containing protein BrxF [Methanomicrobiales archaeon]
MIPDILRKIEESANDYYRLILIAGPTGSGKTALLRKLGRETGREILNVNLELSKALLELTRNERMRKGARLLEEIVDTRYPDNETALFDNTEILFDTDLKIDPLKLLQQLSRERCIVTTWNGTVENETLVYAQPAHREYRTYNTHGLSVFHPDGCLTE